MANRRLDSAADFYEPRMAVAFVRAMEKLQKSINVEALALRIAHRQEAGLLLTTLEKATAEAFVPARNAAIKGIEIGHQVVKEKTVK